MDWKIFLFISYLIEIIFHPLVPTLQQPCVNFLFCVVSVDQPHHGRVNEAWALWSGMVCEDKLTPAYWYALFQQVCVVARLYSYSETAHFMAQQLYGSIFLQTVDVVVFMTCWLIIRLHGVCLWCAQCVSVLLWLFAYAYLACLCTRGPWVRGKFVFEKDLKVIMIQGEIHSLFYRSFWPMLLSKWPLVNSHYKSAFPQQNEKCRITTWLWHSHPDTSSDNSLK